MTDSELHPYVELIAREARRPVFTDRMGRDRVMAAIHAEPTPRRDVRLWERMLEPRAFTLSPAGSALIAAGLVGIGVIAGMTSTNRDVRLPDGQPTVADVRVHLPVSDTVVNFVFIAPQASKVSVVGDFNGWDATKTPLVRAANSGRWTVTLPLTAGRHLYSYVVDGNWSMDPNAPLAPDDGFGHSSSVKIVSRGSAL
ncbi:MAG: hypothetical protein ABJF01_07755 [bacterium]